jgi:hypothetical protein
MYASVCEDYETGTKKMQDKKKGNNISATCPADHTAYKIRERSTVLSC